MNALDIIAKEIGVTKEELKAIATVFYCDEYIYALEEGTKKEFIQLSKTILEKLQSTHEILKGKRK